MPTVERDIHINASKEAVWAVLADFGNVSKWSPGLVASKLTSEGDVGVGSTRVCTAPKFGSFNEEVLEWHPGESFAVELKAFGPMKFSRSKWTLREHGGVTHLNASIDYEVKFGPVGTIMSVLFVKRSISNGFEQALQGLKDHVENGRGVSAEAA
ncbi:MAG: SRPBCC family protein [Alphaproteobacteria bacterium]